MPEIFISYSRKDSSQAQALAERLRGEGMSVWIDREELSGSGQWSAQIVEAISACSTRWLSCSLRMP
jgi:hypothetical protein